jgi:hypothetical protein
MIRVSKSRELVLALEATHRDVCIPIVFAIAVYTERAKCKEASQGRI